MYEGEKLLIYDYSKMINFFLFTVCLVRHYSSPGFGYQVIECYPPSALIV